MTNEISHKKKSLCKKSMMLVANIIKLSTLSLASMSLGTTFKQPPIDCVPATAKVPSVNASMVPEFPRSQRSQEPESNPKQYPTLLNQKRIILRMQFVRAILMTKLQNILRGYMKGTQMIRTLQLSHQ